MNEEAKLYQFNYDDNDSGYKIRPLNILLINIIFAF